LAWGSRAFLFAVVLSSLDDSMVRLFIGSVLLSPFKCGFSVNINLKQCCAKKWMRILHYNICVVSRSHKSNTMVDPR
jgi:hypothetical protein